MTDRETRRASKARAATRPDPRIALAGLAVGAGVLIAAGQAAFGQAGEDTVTAHGYTFFGDLRYAADFDHLDYVNPDAPKGGEISQWAPGTFDGFNPYARVGRPAALSNIGHEAIMTVTADDPTSLYCFLCETLTYPEDLAWVEFELRPEVRFADGTPMTAEDVVFTHDIFIEQALPSFRAAFGGQIDEVEAVDEHRVRFTFAEDAPPRDRISLAGGLPVLSREHFEANDLRIDEAQTEPYMGTGPYELADFDFNRRVVYERRDDYWGADLPINRGRNNFDRIRVEYFADSTAAFEAFKAGEYTFRVENNSLLWATGYDFPAVENGWVVTEEVPDGALATAQSYVFNTRLPKFQDPRVREAIGLMFNFEWSNDALFYGLYDRINSFWENSDLAATGTPSEDELALLRPLVDEGLLDASILTDEAFVWPVSSNRQLDRAALRRASALLEEAGWTVGQDGRWSKDGEVLSVAILEASPTFDRVHDPFVENLRRLGIDATLERVDPAQETDRRRDYDFELTVHTMRQQLEPDTGLEQFFGSEAAEESTRNLMGLMDPAVDRLIEAAVEAGTEEELRAATAALDRVLRAERFWIPHWYKPFHTIAYYDMYRHPEEIPPFALGDLDFWWFDEAAAARLRDAGAL
ncbi:microcin C transport system substrate-binding protein [Hasllibacter halocynthiae]|uniref:Microcin C transport system substrate-binding protein n=1 Tax=Hasllibacter halocynthiae TaxID=595589 RepID=A0A2T0X492_9RHOB|nr:extracellular solute-binding protein [Hasllibacter halocynthiae]PRY93684.1 microcin C transport system substrate-binding protein [Hasllibacter halocynthiae]